MKRLVLFTVIAILLALAGSLNAASPVFGYVMPATVTQTAIAADDPQTYTMLLAAVAMMILIARRRSRSD